MERYIDADELIKKIFPYDVVDKKRYAINAEVVYKAIQNVTTADVVEVIRCKDCEYCNEYRKFNSERYLGCNTNGEIYEVEPNHFCSYGERKEK